MTIDKHQDNSLQANFDPKLGLNFPRGMSSSREIVLVSVLAQAFTSVRVEVTLPP